MHSHCVHGQWLTSAAATRRHINACGAVAVAPSDKHLTTSCQRSDYASPQGVRYISKRPAQYPLSNQVEPTVLNTPTPRHAQNQCAASTVPVRTVTCFFSHRDFWGYKAQVSAMMFETDEQRIAEAKRQLRDSLCGLGLDVLAERLDGEHFHIHSTDSKLNTVYLCGDECKKFCRHAATNT